jgi:L-amino acid N-acyltransferase YncA
VSRPREDETLVIRPAEADDMPAVAAIFARYVLDTVITFELQPPSVQDWREKQRELEASGWPFLVAVVGEELIGYAYVMPWRSKPAYRHTVENTIYLAPEHTGQGHGRNLLGELLTRARDASARQVIAVIADTGHPASVALHRRAKFEDVGRLRNVGYKHGQWIDTVLMQSSLAMSRSESGSASGSRSGSGSGSRSGE